MPVVMSYKSTKKKRNFGKIAFLSEIFFAYCEDKYNNNFCPCFIINLTYNK
jgi:hypothetical protein